MNLILEGKRIKAARHVKEAKSGDGGSKSEGSGWSGLWDTLGRASEGVGKFYEENPGAGTATGALAGSMLLPWYLNSTVGGRRGRRFGLGTSLLGGLGGAIGTEYLTGGGPLTNLYQRWAGGGQGGDGGSGSESGQGAGPGDGAATPQNKGPENSERNQEGEVAKTRGPKYLETSRTPDETKIITQLHRAYPDESVSQLRRRAQRMTETGDMHRLLPGETDKTPNETVASARLHKALPDLDATQLRELVRQTGGRSMPGSIGTEGYKSSGELMEDVETREWTIDQDIKDIMGRLVSGYPNKNRYELRDLAREIRKVLPRIKSK